ncbi:monofunctional biosynthetic peptidoglycan transglycosylase [Albimonas sp. CAU 1670]|uniref:monofunctional biosynthetic peptidoglycan transglycosylase n=1 Tax=Albimonas sp. CAU 1670 TaxID=3032599 RepID=UPI0023DB4443|nr:monofunctional biosynthetic peptidoglycan transglycosylase [Albimonas sp. CAU 1670]MDF2233455.1 monofunctional biosynthetic peptidoglycan transglycosylase [Albimonas sp. CAU 1670]
MAKARKTRRRGLLRRAVELLLLIAAVVVLWVALYRVLIPPTTIYIEQERARLGEIDRRPLDFDALPARVRLAFPAAEDARFCQHSGFDVEAIRQALESNADGGGLRGGSGISQQVAKNAFLWQGRSWIRKGLESGFTVLVEAMWPKRRILEVYLSVAEMGEGIFGLEAAAQRHFGVTAAKLTARQAALIAAALPDPKERDPAHPTGWLSRRAGQIESGAGTLEAAGGSCVLD